MDKFEIRVHRSYHNGKYHYHYNGGIGLQGFGLYNTKSFTKDDKVVIIDNTNKAYVWVKGIVKQVIDEDNILVMLDVEKVTIKVNDRQLIPYEDIKEIANIMGFKDDDFTDWDTEFDLPPTPDKVEATITKCVCPMNQVMWGGCSCEFGIAELKEEGRDS